MSSLTRSLGLLHDDESPRDVDSKRLCTHLLKINYMHAHSTRFFLLPRESFLQRKCGCCQAWTPTRRLFFVWTMTKYTWPVASEKERIGRVHKIDGDLGPVRLTYDFSASNFQMIKTCSCRLYIALVWETPCPSFSFSKCN